MGTILGLAMLLIEPTMPLQASVRVNPKSPSSGTVVKVEKKDDGYKVWILSTGHFSKETGDAVDVQFFYMGGKALEKPLTKVGTVVYKVEDGEKGIDFSVIVLTMDKEPAHVPIAKKSSRPNAKNAKCISIGCDLGSVPKVYSLKLCGYREKDYQTKRNNPQPGRSGGGLFYEGYLVGICWGYNMSNGLFVSHEQIIRHLKRAGLRNLLNE